MDLPSILLKKRQDNNEFPKQKSVEWYNKRYKILTASQVSSILNTNIYQSPFDILIEKIYNSILSDMKSAILDQNNIYNLSSSNTSMDWGNKFEPIAVKFYEFLKKEKVIEIGLVGHPKYDWLGASPDGLLLSGSILEIKCPKTRKINNTIPINYWIQMQIQLEVCDMEVCDYLECEFYEYKSKKEYDSDDYDSDLKGEFKRKLHNSTIEETIYWKINKCYLKSVERDRKWFSGIISNLQDFYIDLVEIKKIASEKIKKQKNMEKLNIYKIIKKTIYKYKKNNNKININLCKFNGLKEHYINWELFVPASKVRNYMLDDPLIDYLEYIDKKNITSNINLSLKNKQNNFTNYLYQKGNSFELNIVNKLKEKFGDNFVTVSNNNHDIRLVSKFIETVQYIKKGVPIIYHGILHDYSKKIYGIPDLLVRRDYLEKIIETSDTELVECIQAKAKIKKNDDSLYKNDNFYHKYVVIEIKYTKLNLCSDGIHITNSNKEVVYNKSQLYIYNKILSEIQDFECPHSYIIGKSYKYNKNNITYYNSSLELMGCVNFKKNDKFIRKKTASAIRWIRDLRKNGNDWLISPPSRDELKPNMCNINDKWQMVKESMASQTNDITQLWMCNPSNRNIAESNNITNWRTHKNLKSKDLGVVGESTSKTLQIIIDINQNTNIDKNIYPKKLHKSVLTINSSIEFYIDFETINTILLDNINSDFIFMIGIGYIKNNKWIFKCFIASDLTLSSELILLNEFHNYILKIISINESTKDNNYTLWHWGNAEKYLYTSALSRHGIYNKLNDRWRDLLKIFKKNNIVAKGMLNFSLKSVVKSFNNNKFIKISYKNLEIINGMDAMVMAYDEYNKSENYNIKNNNIIKEIKKYNEIDCKSIQEILEFLRTKYK